MHSDGLNTSQCMLLHESRLLCNLEVLYFNEVSNYMMLLSHQALS